MCMYSTPRRRSPERGRRSGACATAHLIARSLVFLSQDRRIAPLIDPETVEASLWFMQACSSFTPWRLRLMACRWFRGLVWYVERRSIPGMMLHYVLRKRYLEET